MPKSKGTNLLHMRSYVERVHGPATWQKVLASLSAADHAIVSALSPSGWYPLETQHRLLRSIDRVVSKGDLALVPEIGRYEADQDLSTIHRLFVRLTSPAYVLEKAGEYWRRFYDTGRWDVVRGNGSATGRLAEFGMVDDAFCSYLAAYIHRMFQLAGARSGALEHTECRARGAEACVFVGRWT